MHKRMKTIVSGLLGAIFMSSAAVADYAKDLIPPPAGTQGLLYYFAHTAGNKKYRYGKLVGEDTDFTATINMLRYVYFGEVGGHPWDFNVLVPQGTLSLDGNDVGDREISNTQIGDPLFVAVFWPYANPRSRTYVGLTFYVTPPFGEYDNDKVLNMGSNRWAFRGHMGFEQGIGRFNVGAYAYMEFYTDNDDYTNDHLTLKKHPYVGAEAHVTCDVSKIFFTALDYFYEQGGQTEVQHVHNPDKLDDHSGGFTFGFQLNPSVQLLLNYLKKIHTENGIKTDTVGLRLGYFF